MNEHNHSYRRQYTPLSSRKREGPLPATTSARYAASPPHGKKPTTQFVSMHSTTVHRVRALAGRSVVSMASAAKGFAVAVVVAVEALVVLLVTAVVLAAAVAASAGPVPSAP